MSHSCLQHRSHICHTAATEKTIFRRGRQPVGSFDIGEFVFHNNDTYVVNEIHYVTSCSGWHDCVCHSCPTAYSWCQVTVSTVVATC